LCIKVGKWNQSKNVINFFNRKYIWRLQLSLFFNKRLWIWWYIWLLFLCMNTFTSWLVTMRCSGCQTCIFCLSWKAGKYICGLHLSSVWRSWIGWDIRLLFQFTNVFISWSVTLSPLGWWTFILWLIWFFVSVKN
jgi:hypothetical protein